LLPYMYSQLGSCYLNDETMARPFVMDFPTDKISNQCKRFVYARSFIACEASDG
jgi:alpha-glucosidase (family GH31 glycosyl hydrolase)